MKLWLPIVCLMLLIAGCANKLDQPGSSNSPIPLPTDGQHAPGEQVPGEQVPGEQAPGGQAPGADVEEGSDSGPGPGIDPVADRLATMTLDEKIGQMLIAGLPGTHVNEETESLIKEDHIGGIIFYKDNLADLSSSLRLVNDLKEANQGNRTPLFISVDQEGGRVSRMPSAFTATPANGVIGKTKDAEIARGFGEVIGEQLTLMGINMNFAPVLDVNSNPDNPVIGDRSFGQAADVVSELGVAHMQGIQSRGTIAVVKHFPGHGDTSVDSHLDLPVLDKTVEELQSFEWMPFQAAIEAGADAVMVAHILFPQIDADHPASFSKTIITGGLRETLRYDGVVMTDDMTMGAIAEHYDLGEASVLSVLAGTDIVLVAHGYDQVQTVIKALRRAVQEERLTEERMNQSVYRILSLKNKYALTDQETEVPDVSDVNKEITHWLDRL